MEKDVGLRKRKAPATEVSVEKMKKVKKTVTAEMAVPEKKRKATEEAAPVTVKKSKNPNRKPTLEDVPGPKTKATSRETISDKAVKNTKDYAIKTAKRALKEVRSAKPTMFMDTKDQKPAKPPRDVEDASEDVEDEAEDSEIDDQTEALLKGFESDEDEEDAINGEGLKDGEEVPTVPDVSNQSKKQLQRDLEFKKDDDPGVVYIGRIPHGFYEHEMRDYFKQFGTILKLRLSRNRQTGASKHVAWIQFESSAVAEIVAKTMNNYLLFNHILQVKVVPKDQIPANLFKGANKRFKKVPWNKIAGRELRKPKSENAWEKQNARVQARRLEKANKLKAIGFDYEFEAPKLKSAKNIAKKAEQPALSDQDALKAIEPVHVIEKGMTHNERNDGKSEINKKAKAN